MGKKAKTKKKTGPKSKRVEKKACPFCGSLNMFYNYDNGLIQCADCMSCGPKVVLSSEEYNATFSQSERRCKFQDKAVDLWNKRA